MSSSRSAASLAPKHALAQLRARRARAVQVARLPPRGANGAVATGGIQTPVCTIDLRDCTRPSVAFFRSAKQWRDEGRTGVTSVAGTDDRCSPCMVC